MDTPAYKQSHMVHICIRYMSVILNYNNLACVSLATSFGAGVNWIGAVLQNYFWYSVSQMLILFWNPGERSHSMNRAALWLADPGHSQAGSCECWGFWQSWLPGLNVQVYLQQVGALVGNSYIPTIRSLWSTLHERAAFFYCSFHVFLKNNMELIIIKIVTDYFLPID